MSKLSEERAMAKETLPQLVLRFARELWPCSCGHSSCLGTFATINEKEKLVEFITAQKYKALDESLEELIFMLEDINPPENNNADERWDDETIEMIKNYAEESLRQLRNKYREEKGKI